MLPVQLLPQVGHRSCAHTDSAGKKKTGQRAETAPAHSPAGFLSGSEAVLLEFEEKTEKNIYIHIFITLHVHFPIVRFNNPDLNSVLRNMV